MADYPIYFGWLSVFIAFLAWGSFAVPSKKGEARKVSPMIYQAIFNVYVFIFSWAPAIYTKFKFTIYGVYGAMFWVPASIFSFSAIRLIGLGVGQSIWGSVTIVVSFSLGRLPSDSLTFLLVF